MTKKGSGITRVFLSTIDDIDFNVTSRETYGKLLEDADRRQAMTSIRFEEDQKRNIVSGLLLQYCFHQWLKQTGQPDVSEYRCGRLQYGKPFIEGHESFCFSISHSGRYVICATGESAVGADIEVYAVQKNINKIAKRFFAKTEYEQMMTLKEEEQIAYFTRLWTMKESYIKCNGRGLGYGMDTFYAEGFEPLSNYPGKLVHRVVDQNVKDGQAVFFACEYFFEPDVCLTVCSEQETFSDKPEVIPMRGYNP